jgi:hypothetical protein
VAIIVALVASHFSLVEFQVLAASSIARGTISSFILLSSPPLILCSGEQQMLFILLFYSLPLHLGQQQMLAVMQRSLSSYARSLPKTSSIVIIAKSLNFSIDTTICKNLFVVALRIFLPTYESSILSPNL